jgi:hypothetical protein
MQTSMVFSQRKWPGVGDIDDCWVLSGIQCINVTAPWLRLVSVPAFRKAARKPDIQGQADGGQIVDIKRGVEALFPDWYSGPTRVRLLRGESWQTVKDLAAEGRPLSLAVVSAKLPTRMQYGFAGYHQVSLVQKGNGRWLLANPLAQPYARWQEIDPAELRSAVMAYGRAKSGSGGAWFAAFPTDTEMAAIYRPFDDSTPFDQEDVDRITAAIASERDDLAGRIDGALDALTGDTP